MAGIGFELKKLFRRKGLFASLRAYGYAGIICTGPMLLGVALQMGILLLCGWVGAERAQQDLLVCMITYTLLFSLTVTSFFSMPVTRYLADMLYEEQEQTILPSFWGSSSMMLVLGCALYGLFLLVSGATLLQGLLCLWLFAEMIVNWNAMSYLTAIKDYRGILCSFLAAIALADDLGLSTGAVAKGLSDFGGADRRFQYKGCVDGVTIIDDYAHHPTEIRATLTAAKNYPHKRLVLCFQPHTYSRTKAFLEDFADVLSLADVVVLADIYAAREKNTYGVSSRDILSKLRERGTECYYFPSFEEIEKFLLKNCVNGDLLITMGAGDIVNVGEHLLGK